MVKAELGPIFSSFRLGPVPISFLVQREIFSALGGQGVRLGKEPSVVRAFPARARFRKLIPRPLVYKFEFNDLWEPGETLVVVSSELQLRACEVLIEGFLQEGARVRVILPRNAHKWLVLDKSLFKKCSVNFLSKPMLPRFLGGFSLLLVRQIGKKVGRTKLILRTIDCIAQQLEHVESIRRVIRKSRPSCIVTGRPVGLSAAFACAGYIEKVPTVFVSHTVLRENFYNLELYSHASVSSPACRDLLTKTYPSMNVIATGAPFHSLGRIRTQMKTTDALRVGFLATNLKPAQIEDLQILSEATDDPRIRLYVKCHPHHPYAERIRKVTSSRRHNEVIVFEHQEQSLLDFVRNSHVIVSEKSNSGLEAAVAGVPTIFWLSNKTAGKAMDRNSVEITDVALWTPSDSGELRAIFLYLLSPELRKGFIKLQRMQRKIARNFFPDLPGAEMQQFIRDGKLVPT